uniref:Uncharacterized protein n=1 Tax=Pithovirus LCPAC304 TaxID=2506594 RepID=A0A481Z9P1_9VIRU|nr:MAG: hypothetical protein LCPAC304_05420 [Pithovirus LCPAC304]
MSSVSRYADTHTLYVLSGAARNEDLKNVVLGAVQNLEKKTRTKYPCRAITNLIYDREGVPYGFGYLHVSNPEVYHMLLGKNPDGSKREKVIDTSMDDLDPCEPIEWFNWADSVEQHIHIVTLPSMLPLPPLPYTQHHKLLFKKMVTNIRESEKQHLDPDQFDPNMCTFQLYSGQVKPVPENRSPHILCARDIPEWLNPRDVYSVFRPFVTNATKRIRKRGKQGSVEIHYPLVTINRNNKLCFVEFDALTKDAQFALIMTTKVDFKANTSPTKRPLEKTLIFTHAFKSNKKRDFSKGGRGRPSNGGRGRTHPSNGGRGRPLKTHKRTNHSHV